MGKYVVKKPMILYETIETIFRYVNGRTVAKEKRRIFEKVWESAIPRTSGADRTAVQPFGGGVSWSVRPFPRVQSLHTIFSGGT